MLSLNYLKRRLVLAPLGSQFALFTPFFFGVALGFFPMVPFVLRYQALAVGDFSPVWGPMCLF